MRKLNKWWKKLKSDFKASRTVRLAWFKKIIGLLILNAALFQDSMSGATFGALMIILGIVDYKLRSVTTKKLPEVK